MDANYAFVLDTEKVPPPPGRSPQATHQQGTLAGEERREYPLVKVNHTCVYCGAWDVRFEIDHIVARPREGERPNARTIRRSPVMTATYGSYPHTQPSCCISSGCNRSIPSPNGVNSAYGFKINGLINSLTYLNSTKYTRNSSNESL
jgi:hypothetical protein